MKVFVARVEEHTYEYVIDNYTHLKVFRFKEDADAWARTECERIMHENYDQYIDHDDHDVDYTYIWDDYHKYTCNFSSDDNDEHHYCYYSVEEHDIVGCDHEGLADTIR